MSWLRTLLSAFTSPETRSAASSVHDSPDLREHQGPNSQDLHSTRKPEVEPPLVRGGGSSNARALDDIPDELPPPYSLNPSGDDGIVSSAISVSGTRVTSSFGGHRNHDATTSLDLFDETESSISSLGSSIVAAALAVRQSNLDKGAKASTKAATATHDSRKGSGSQSARNQGSSASQRQARAEQHPRPVTYNGMTPSNFVFAREINRNVNGRWLLDTTSVQERGNDNVVWLESSNGSIIADISIIRPENGYTGAKRIRMKVESQNGSVDLSLRDVVIKNQISLGRVPLEVRVESMNGSVKIRIPRSFRGFIKTEAMNGRSFYRDNFGTSLKQLPRDMYGNNQVFHGQGNPREDEMQGYDQLYASASNGNIDIFYAN